MSTSSSVVRAAVTHRFEPTAADPGVVLLVTGDADLREVAARVLGREGYRVLTAAHSGHAVLACLQAPRVDVALIEMSMVDTSGPALAERLRRHSPEMRTVYLAQTGSVDCDGVLVRPFTREDLLAELTRSLANS